MLPPSGNNSMRTLAITLAVLVVLIFAGCGGIGESPCAQTELGKPNPACMKEIKKQQQGEEVKAEAGEVEGILRRERAEETARAIREVTGR